MYRDVIKVGVRDRKNYYWLKKTEVCVHGGVGSDKLCKECHGALLHSLPLYTLIQPRMAVSPWHTRRTIWRAPGDQKRQKPLHKGMHWHSRLFLFSSSQDNSGIQAEIMNLSLPPLSFLPLSLSLSFSHKFFLLLISAI